MSDDPKCSEVSHGINPEEPRRPVHITIAISNALADPAAVARIGSQMYLLIRSDLMSADAVEPINKLLSTIADRLSLKESTEPCVTRTCENLTVRR